MSEFKSYLYNFHFCTVYMKDISTWNKVCCKMLLSKIFRYLAVFIVGTIQLRMKHRGGEAVGCYAQKEPQSKELFKFWGTVASPKVRHQLQSIN